MDKPTARLQPDAAELILGADPRYICETYIFDPVQNEESLGRLFAVGETEDRGGVGQELLDLTIQALQREYYREPSRGILASFESALHQANLVLHDTAEQGVRDWMGSFHVAAGILAHDVLHLSTAGNATVLLSRRSRITEISADLSHSPITNPLRTFAQVASGTITTRDLLFFGTSQFSTVFTPEELTRLSIDHSASAISTRLQQLYADKGALAPLAGLTISILPQHIPQVQRESAPLMGLTRRIPRGITTSLTPRKPLIINRSWLKTILVFAARIVVETWQRLKQRVLPLLVQGSRTSGRAILHVSRSTGKNVQSLTQKWRQSEPTATSTMTASAENNSRAASLLSYSPRLPSAQTITQAPSTMLQLLRDHFRELPRSSKIFALITLVLALSLVVSVILLQQKRAEESVIQRGSELLHDARNSKNAAEDALIYDNRDQARNLVAQAQTNIKELETMELYQTEVQQLKTDLAGITDRLQKIVRPAADSGRTVGDFASLLDGKKPTHLEFVNDTLYTFNPENNTILAMNSAGTATVATQTSEGIGFFTSAISHEADKLIILATSSPGIAIFDAKNNTIQSQDIALPSDKTELTTVATYGGRLYVYDKAAATILSFTKTLRGYAGGTPWITNDQFPKDTIRSIGVDGNIYTLHTDGSLRKLLKGEPVDFKVDPVDPPLASATKLLKTENFKNLYVVDLPNKRLVVFNDKGQLLRQLFLDIAPDLQDIAISSDEKTLYVLDGTRVVAIPLAS